MASELPLILQIQQDCLDQNSSVSSILRKAKVAATKLELTDFLHWISNEIDGYPGEFKDLPAYRMLIGQRKFFNPIHGWQPLLFGNPDTARLLSTAAVNQSIGPMEDMLQNDQEGNIYIYPYTPEVKVRVITMLPFPTDVHIE